MTRSGPSSPLKRTRERRVGGPVCGVDEVGRGPLAGPVVAAAVILPERMPRGLGPRIDDSKKLTAEGRAEIALLIHDCALVSIGVGSVEEIDAINILRSSLMAMRRAIESLSQTPVHALIDGHMKPPVDILCETVIGGDGLELSIAAASIVAKVHRDRLMHHLHDEHPHYGWRHNAGYATPHHRAAIRDYGACRHHRTSFAPVREALQNIDSREALELFAS